MKKIILTVCTLILLSGCNQQDQGNNEEIERLSNRIQQLEDSMSELKQKNDQLTQENNKLKKEIEDTKTKANIKPDELELKNVKLTDCKSISEFKGKSWFSLLEDQFKKIELPPTVGQSKYGNLSDYDYMGEGCLSEGNSVFVFVNIYGLYVYNIESNVVKRNSYPHITFEFGNTSFGDKGDNYIEIKSAGGDGQAGSSYYAKYYFLDNKVELYKKCFENSVEETCDDVKKIFE